MKRFFKTFWVMMTLYALLFAGVRPAPAQYNKAAELDHFYSGNDLYNRKMFALAILEYKQFLQQFPKHAKAEEARHGIALSYYCSAKYNEAVPVFTELIKNRKAGNTDQLGVLLGQSYLRLNNPAEAEQAFAAVSKSRTAGTFMTIALAGLSEAQFKQQKWEETTVTAKKLMQSKPEPEYVKRGLYQSAYANYQLKKYELAVPLLEQLAGIVKDDPLEPRAAFFLGECYRETKKLDKASEQYAKALKGLKDPDVVTEVYYRQGFVNFVQEKYDDAVIALKECLKTQIEGDFAEEAMLYIGRSYLENKKYNEAVQYLQRLSGKEAQAARKNKQGKKPRKVTVRTAKYAADAEAVMWLGRCYSRQNNYQQAATILAEAIPRFNQSPLLPDLHFDHANALMVIKKYKEAAVPLQSVLRYKDWPQLNDATRLYAICLHHNMDYNGSQNYVKQFMETYKDDKLLAEIAFLKGENLYLLNQLEAADKAYSEYIATYPKHVSIDPATFRVGQIRHKQGKWKDSIKAAEPLAAKDPEGEIFSQLHFIVGDSYFRLENWDKAIVSLYAFLDKNSHHTEEQKKLKGKPLPKKTPKKKKPPKRIKPQDRRKLLKDRNSGGEPNLDTAMAQLAVCHMNRKENEEAIEILLDLTAYFDQQSPHLPLALSELGRLLYESGDVQGAEANLKKFVELFAQDTRRYSVEYYLGWCALSNNEKQKRKEYEEAAEQHFAYLVKNTQHALAPDAALQLGLVQLSMGKHREAGQMFSHLERSYPEHPDMALAVFSHAVSYARQERWKEGAALFKKLVEEHPKSELADRAVYEWAWCEKGLKRKTEAIARYEFLIKTYPDSDLVIKTRTELAELTFDAKQFDEVIAQLKESLTELKDEKLKEQTHYRLGTAYFNKGDFEAAAKTFEDFIEAYPGSTLLATVYFQAGESRLILKETVPAREHFLAASKMKTRDPNESRTLLESTLMRLGETQGLTKQWAESAQTYSSFLRSYGHGDQQSKWVPRATFGLGWAYEKQEKYPQAIEQYRIIVALQGKDELSARCQFQIGECLFALKKHDEAIQEFVRVGINYRHNDWTAKATLEMGRVLEVKGDKERAMESFKEVVKKFPQHDAAVVAKTRLNALRHGS